MKQSEIIAYQKLQLKMMKMIHQVCLENNIEYYIIGGTLLGSVRHKGFIPWDIDIDIAMTRANYQKFKIVAENKLPQQLIYMDYTKCHDFRPPHAIVEWNKSSVQHSSDMHISKIYIDIFPLDYAPNSIEKQKQQANKIFVLKRLKTTKILSRADKLNRNFFKRCFFKAFRLFSPFINIDIINNKLQAIMQMYNMQENPKYLCSMASHYSYFKQCMPKEIYGKPQLMIFCDAKFFGPEKPDEYLKRIYGDYMKQPSIREQQKFKSYFMNASWED